MATDHGNVIRAVCRKIILLLDGYINVQSCNADAKKLFKYLKETLEAERENVT